MRLFKSVLVILAVSIMIVLCYNASSRASGPLLVEEICVAPGDTLWTIAVRTAPNTDPRITVDRIMLLNHKQTSALLAGETLEVPVAYQGE